VRVLRDRVEGSGLGWVGAHAGTGALGRDARRGGLREWQMADAAAAPAGAGTGARRSLNLRAGHVLETRE
jgi:hypothetical protein